MTASSGHELLAGVDEPVEALGHLHPREALLARVGVDGEHAQREREPGDVRERLARPDGERRQHRVDLALEVLPRAVRSSLSRAVLDRRDLDPRRGERRSQLALPEPRLPRRRARSTRSRIACERLRRRQPVGRANARGRPRPSSSRPGDAHHEELVEVLGEDRGELDALEQRERVVLGELEHAGVELDPRELPVEEPGLRRVGAVGHGLIVPREPSQVAAWWSAGVRLVDRARRRAPRRAGAGSGRSAARTPASASRARARRIAIPRWTRSTSARSSAPTCVVELEVVGEPALVDVGARRSSRGSGTCARCRAARPGRSRGSARPGITLIDGVREEQVELAPLDLARRRRRRRRRRSRAGPYCSRAVAGLEPVCVGRDVDRLRRSSGGRRRSGSTRGSSRRTPSSCASYSSRLGALVERERVDVDAALGDEAAGGRRGALRAARRPRSGLTKTNGPHVSTDDRARDRAPRGRSRARGRRAARCAATRRGRTSRRGTGTGSSRAGASPSQSTWPRWRQTLTKPRSSRRGPRARTIGTCRPTRWRAARARRPGRARARTASERPKSRSCSSRSDRRVRRTSRTAACGVRPVVATEPIYARAPRSVPSACASARYRSCSSANGPSATMRPPSIHSARVQTGRAADDRGRQLRRSRPRRGSPAPCPPRSRGTRGRAPRAPRRAAGRPVPAVGRREAEPGAHPL